MVPRTFLFMFHAGSRRLGSNNFQNSSYKEKTTGSALFPDYLYVSYDWLCQNQLRIRILENERILGNLESKCRYKLALILPSSKNICLARALKTEKIQLLNVPFKALFYSIL